MIVYDRINAKEGCSPRPWRAAARCGPSTSVPRAVVAQDSDVAGFVCGATHGVWSWQSLRRHPPAGRIRLHLYRHALASPTAHRPVDSTRPANKAIAHYFSGAFLRRMSRVLNLIAQPFTVWPKRV